MKHGPSKPVTERGTPIQSLQPEQLQGHPDRIASMGVKDGTVYNRRGDRCQHGLADVAMLSNFGPGVLANFGPPPVPEPTVSPMDRGAFCGLESQSGFVRAAPSGARVWYRHDRGRGREVWCSSARRAAGDRGALPPAQHYPERTKPKLGAVAEFIDKVLDEDRRAPRKQRHTARRIHRRILREFPDTAVAELTVRNHVRERKRQMGLERRETFVPQSYSWAQEAQVDWYEAWVDLGDERTKVQVFAMRSMASGAAFHRAYLHATQQAFLEAHEHAFAYFGGVFNCCATIIWRVRCAKSCAVTGAKRRCGSSRSARIGGLPLNSARRARVTRRAALKAKAAISGATTWYRCRVSSTSMR